MFFIVKEQEININDNIFAIYFYANWLPMHKKMMVMIDKIERKHNIKFLAVDVDAFKGLCKRFDVNNIPTVIIFKDNNEIKRINGVVMTSAFKSAFADICNTSSNK